MQNLQLIDKQLMCGGRNENLLQDGADTVLRIGGFLLSTEESHWSLKCTEESQDESFHSAQSNMSVNCFL